LEDEEAEEETAEEVYFFYINHSVRSISPHIFICHLVFSSVAVTHHTQPYCSCVEQSTHLEKLPEFSLAMLATAFTQPMSAVVCIVLNLLITANLPPDYIPQRSKR